MNIGTLKLLLAGLVLLAVLYLGSILLGLTDDGTTEGLTIPELTVSTVENIVISSDEGEYSVIKDHDSGSWTVDGHPVPTSTVEQVLVGISSIQTGAAVSNNPDNHSLFEVNEATGTIVRIEGEPDLSLIIGKSGTGFNQFYLRSAGADEVYLTQSTARSILVGGADGWREKTILSLPPEQGQTKISFEYPDELFSLVREGAGWVVQREESSSDVGSVDASRLYTDLSNLVSERFATEEEVKAADSYESIAMITVIGNRSIATISVSKIDDTSFYWTRNGSSEAWITSKATADRVLIRP